MKQKLYSWKALLTRLQEESNDQEIKEEIAAMLSEIETILSGGSPPKEKIIKKIGFKVSDVVFSVLYRYSEHEVVHFVVNKILHML
jgi:hypothetical protein